MKSFSVNDCEMPSANMPVDLFPQTPSHIGLWRHGEVSRLSFSDDVVSYHRNRSSYNDGCRLELRLKRGNDYRIDIAFSSISSSVDIRCIAEKLSIDRNSVGRIVSLTVHAQTIRAHVFFQTPNDLEARFAISSVRITQLTPPPRDLFAATLGRTGGPIAKALYGLTDTGLGGSIRGGLKTVLCPLTPSEISKVTENFARWNELYNPFEKGLSDAERPQLVFSFNCAPRPELAALLVDAFDRLHNVRSAFGGIEVLFCSLPPEKDLYIRTPSSTPPEYGYKAGPNWLFYESLRRLKARGGMLFLMETDCHPVVAGWLGALSKVAERHSDAWVIGGLYSGVSSLDATIVRHINGNALYNLEDPRFGVFLEEFWDWMLEYIRDHDRNLAYDCAWEIFARNAHTCRHEYDRSCVVTKVASKFRMSEFIVNVAGQAELDGRYIFSEDDIRRRFPNAILAHGPVSHSRGHERGAMSVGRARHDLEPVAPGHPAAGAGTVFERSFWFTGDTFHPDDRLEFDIGFNGAVQPDWLFSLTQLNGVQVPLERIETQAAGAANQVRLWASVATELHVLIFRLETGAVARRFTLVDLSVTLERNGRTIAEFASLL